MSWRSETGVIEKKGIDIIGYPMFNKFTSYDYNMYIIILLVIQFYNVINLF